MSVLGGVGSRSAGPESARSHSYGGQAVLEGVMMRGRHAMSISVRRTDGEIVRQDRLLRTLGQRFPILRRPLLRGCVALVESLTLGVGALNYSASVFAEGEGEELGPRELAVSIVFAVALTVGLFVILPAFIIRLVSAAVHSHILLNLIEGGIKVSFFVLYILIISLMPDIRRVFQYHGAEHKAINCYEDGGELSVAKAQQYSTVHARCGTNFILIVLFTSVLVFSFFGRPPFLQRVLIHLAILPLVAGISYEIIKLASRQRAFFLIKLVAAPGMWLQKLTTKEPDDSQVEVALDALRSVLRHDREVASRRAARGPGPVLNQPG